MGTNEFKNQFIFWTLSYMFCFNLKCCVYLPLTTHLIWSFIHLLLYLRLSWLFIMDPYFFCSLRTLVPSITGSASLWLANWCYTLLSRKTTPRSSFFGHPRVSGFCLSMNPPSDRVATSLSSSVISLAKLVSTVSGSVANSELDISFLPLSLYFTWGTQHRSLPAGRGTSVWTRRRRLPRWAAPWSPWRA